jgi:hypothetical protein
VPIAAAAITPATVTGTAQRTSDQRKFVKLFTGRRSPNRPEDREGRRTDMGTRGWGR